MLKASLLTGFSVGHYISRYLQFVFFLPFSLLTFFSVYFSSALNSFIHLNKFPPKGTEKAFHTFKIVNLFLSLVLSHCLSIFLSYCLFLSLILSHCLSIFLSYCLFLSLVLYLPLLLSLFLSLSLSIYIISLSISLFLMLAQDTKIN